MTIFGLTLDLLHQNLHFSKSHGSYVHSSLRNTALCHIRLHQSLLWISKSNFFFLFAAIPVAYRSSQVGGQIGTAAAAAVYATGTAMPDLSHINKLLHSLQQSQILNPLRPGTKPTSSQTLYQVLILLSHNGNPFNSILIPSSEQLLYLLGVQYHEKSMVEFKITLQSRHCCFPLQQLFLTLSLANSTQTSIKEACPAAPKENGVQLHLQPQAQGPNHNWFMLLMGTLQSHFSYQ